MFEFFTHLETWAKWLVSVGGALVLVAAFARWVLPKWRAAKADARAIRDTLVGREPTLDSITGEEIRPAIPGIGARMSLQEQHGASMERQMTMLTRAVADMANNQARIDSLEGRVSALERGAVERVATKAESIQLFSTLEAIAKDEGRARPDDQETP